MAQEGLTRRGLLAGILACAVAPAFVRAAMPVKALTPSGIVGPEGAIFRGEIGFIDDIRIISTPLNPVYDQKTVRAWAEAMRADLAKPSFFAKQLHFIEEVRTGPGTPYFLMPPTPWSELK
jgi:hypothetical protein